MRRLCGGIVLWCAVCIANPHDSIDMALLNGHIENVKSGIGFEAARKIAAYGVQNSSPTLRARSIDLYRALVKKNRYRMQAFAVVSMFQNSVYAEESLAATRLFLALSEE